MGASDFSDQHSDIWRPPGVSALPGSSLFSAVRVGPIMDYFKDKKTELKEQKVEKSDEEETGLELENEPRVILTPLKTHSRARFVSSNAPDDPSRKETRR